MTVLLWVNSEADEAIDLGSTFPFYSAFSEMERIGGDNVYEEYPELFGVIDQTESQDDAVPEWLSQVKEQAQKFKDRYETDLSDRAKSILNALLGQEDDDNGESEEEG